MNKHPPKQKHGTPCNGCWGVDVFPFPSGFLLSFQLLVFWLGCIPPEFFNQKTSQKGENSQITPGWPPPSPSGPEQKNKQKLALTSVIPDISLTC